MVKEQLNCVCCNSLDLKQIMDFGNQPLANSFHVIDDVLPEFPLRLNLCRNCYHLQLSHIVSPDLLFKNYLYVSGTSKTMLDYFDWCSDFILELCHPKTVLDIACNDGSQLDFFKKKGCETFGIDPAENLFTVSSIKGHNVICDYFKDGVYDKTFDVILAQNVFAHTENPLQFLLDCEKIMDNNSHLFIQTSQANMVLENQFDTVYHEHISFFNINSMNELVKRTGLHLIDVIKTPIHGISYLFIFSKKSINQARIKNLIEVERLQGFQNLETYENYRNSIKTTKNKFIQAIDEYNQRGYLFFGYGAAAKGMTFLNYVDFSPDVVIDDNPLKQGLYCPGNNSKVVSIDILPAIKEEAEILFIPLAWNYFDEIKERIKLVRNNPNDKFLKYFPNVRVE